MSSAGSGTPAPKDPVLMGIDVSQQPTNQEAIVIPYLAGQAILAPKFISPIYNHHAVESPNAGGGKK